MRPVDIFRAAPADGVASSRGLRKGFAVGWRSVRSVSVVVVMVMLTIGVVMLAPPPSPASASNSSLLAGEQFGGVADPAGMSYSCDPAGTSTLIYATSGTATGPYPGTFTESGTVTIGPQTIAASDISGTHLAGQVLTFHAQFQINSDNGTVVGTKTLTALLPGDTATNLGACASFTDSTDFASGNVASASGSVYYASVRSTYDATVSTTAGQTLTDSGTSSTTYSEVKITGVKCVPGRICVFATVSGSLNAASPPAVVEAVAARTWR